MDRSRLLPLLLILLLVGGGAAYWKREAVRGFWLGTVQPRLRLPAPPAEPSPAPTAIPRSASKLPPPAPSGEKQFAPPGTFYMIERVKVTSRDGIKAINPGEQVKLLGRRSNGSLEVTIDGSDFVVPNSKVTNEVEKAREAERRFHDSPPRDL